MFNLLISHAPVRQEIKKPLLYYIFPSLSTQEAAESYKPNISEFEDLF